MKLFFYSLAFLFTSFSAIFSHENVSTQNRKAIFAAIPKTALRKQLLFATLYPNTEEGEKALKEAFETISTKAPDGSIVLPSLFANNVKILSSLSDPSLFTQTDCPELSDETRKCIEELGGNLPHRALKGHHAQSLQEVEALESREVDLARALLLLEAALSPGKNIQNSSVESTLDLLALAVLARVGEQASPSVKIKELNRLLFDELGVRFPPQSEAEEKVQQFSELSTVLFSRRGICLGASTLYLCLAQRIGLPLSIFTPPGHIFVGYKDAGSLRVIETTARGIDIPVTEYLGTSLRSLPDRSLKEVIGMVAYNRASNAMKEKKWEQAFSLYTLAHRFESDEELILMTSLSELMLNKQYASMHHAREALKKPSPYRLEHDLMLIDLSKGTLSKESAAAILETISDDPEKLPEYIQKLEKSLLRDPSSLSLHLHIAHCWFSYGTPKRALPYLEKASSLKDAPCSIHFFLAQLYESRMNIPAAWNEAKKAVLLAKQQGMIPKPLRQFILSLHNESPNCEDLSDLLLCR